MSIYEFLLTKSAEETGVDVTDETIPEVNVDEVSPEEDEVDGLTEDDHVENVDAIEDVNDDIEEFASLEHFTVSVAAVAQVLSHMAGEEITGVMADSVNAHIDGIESFVTMNGGPALNSRKFSQEDFSDDSTPETRAVIAAASAEDFKSTAKAAIKKSVEALLNLIKKIKEIVMRLFANTDKLKARAEAAQKKAGTIYTANKGTRTAGNALCVSGKVDIKGAVSSFKENIKLIMQHSDKTDSENGIKNFMELARSFDDAKASKLTGSFDVKTGKSAGDAKIIAELGGNVNVGVGGGCLYTVDVPSSKKDSQYTALSKSDIASVCSSVISDYNALNTLKAHIEVVEKNLAVEVASMNAAATVKAASGDASKAESRLVNLAPKALNRRYAKSGISVLSRVGTLCYMTSYEAIKACEWSMGGKAGKEVTVA